MNTPTNKPNKHHFLPVFYLRQWADADRKIVRFTKPYGNMVKPLRVHPDGAGYIERLYAVEGLPDEEKQDLETEFLSPVDSRAADALRAMLAGESLTKAQRFAWARFICTLLFRMPDDITKLKENVLKIREMIIPGLEKICRALPIVDKNDNFANYVNATRKNDVAAGAIKAVRRLMNNDDIVSILSTMEWSILTTDSAKHELLTSDRPIIHSNNLNQAETHLIVPIGPRRLFIAVKDRRLIARVISAGQDKLVRTVNEFVVSNAVVTVCARTDFQLRFIQNRMGIGVQPSLLSQLPEMRKLIVAEFMRIWEMESSLMAQDLPKRIEGIELNWSKLDSDR